MSIISYILEFSDNIKARFFSLAKAIPGVSAEIEKQKNQALSRIQSKLKMKDDPMPFEGWRHEGLSKEKILDVMSAFSTRESPSWKDGRLSGKVYNGRDEVNEVCTNTVNIYSN